MPQPVASGESLSLEHGLRLLSWRSVLFLSHGQGGQHGQWHHGEPRATGLIRVGCVGTSITFPPGPPDIPDSTEANARVSLPPWKTAHAPLRWPWGTTLLLAGWEVIRGQMDEKLNSFGCRSGVGGGDENWTLAEILCLSTSVFSISCSHLAIISWAVAVELAPWQTQLLSYCFISVC